jgi:hypothetical protein
MNILSSLSENEKKLLFNFIRFADEHGLTRLDEVNIHTNTREFGVRPLTLEATFSKLCQKSVLVRSREEDDTYYYKIDPECVDEIDDFTENYKPKTNTNEDIVPASDRFVSLGDNNEVLNDTEASLIELSKAITTSNELFANADERIQVSREINHLVELIKEPQIHVIALWDGIKRNHTLKWLMEQSVSGVVRTAASKAFEHLDKLIHLLFPH